MDVFISSRMSAHVIEKYVLWKERSWFSIIHFSLLFFKFSTNVIGLDQTIAWFTCDCENLQCTVNHIYIFKIFARQHRSILYHTADKKYQETYPLGLLENSKKIYLLKVRDITSNRSHTCIIKSLKNRSSENPKSYSQQYTPQNT